MKYGARIPIIPLPYSDKSLAVERELIIDYGQEGKFPNLYVVDAKDKNKLWDITEGIRQSLIGAPGDDFTVIIDGLGTVKIGDVLNLIYSTFLTHDENFKIEDIKKMIPTKIVNKSGIIYAPKTLATEVYMDSGESIDVRLKSFSRVGMVTRQVIATEEYQNSFVIPFPFERYLDEGNTFWIQVGGIMVDEYRYHLDDNNTKITFIDPEDYVAKDRSCTFVFWYNSATPDTGVLAVMDGKYITPKSLDTNRLRSTSDSIGLNDPESVATSRAVCTLHNVLSERIDQIAGNKSITALSQGSSTELKLVIPEYILSDTNNIHLRLHVDIAPNATLKINDNPAFPIYNGNNRVQAGPVAGDIINLSFNSLDNRFYIYDIAKFKLERTLYIANPKQGSSVIQFNFGSFNPLIDLLDVYLNGMKMFEHTNYEVGENSITLIDFTSETGDTFVFELIQLVPVKV